MVYHGTQVSFSLPKVPETSAESTTSLQSPPATMEIELTGPMADDYDVTEKCLNWQNNCATTQGLQNLSTQPGTPELLDNKMSYRFKEPVDNAYCSSSYQLSISANFITEDHTLPKPAYDETAYASDFSSQDKLDGQSHCCSSDALSHCDSHCPSMPIETPSRIRRDSEESEESMDTSSSMASSPYACSIASKFTESMSNTSGSGHLILEPVSEDENEQNLNKVKHIPSIDSCTCTIAPNSYIEKTTLSPVREEELGKLPMPKSEPFSCHIEQADPEFAINPPVVTDNLIYVEDESFLHYSQNSLDQCPLDDCQQGSFLVRASTLPDLQAYHRYHNEYGMCWDYQDARIFLSEDILSKSMCSLSNSDSLIIEKDSKAESGHGYQSRQRSTSIRMIDIEGNPIKITPNSDHATTMILLSLCVSILFASTDVIRNLQTSLHPKDGLGMITLVLIFAGYTLGSLLSYSLMQHAQPRVCLITSIIPNILFLLANLSSTLWLLAPISFLQGISMAVTWSVLSTYITYLASGQAVAKKQNIKAVCSRFFNYFSLIYQSLLLGGNLASSMLLRYGNSMHSMNSSFFSSPPPSEAAANDADLSPYPSLTKAFSSGNQSSNKSSADFISDSSLGICGASYCNPGHVIDGGDPWLHPNDGTIYMLHGTFIGCILVSLGMAVFGIEPLNMSLFSTSTCSESRQMKNLCLTVKKSFKSMISGCFALKFVLLLPLFMYSVLQFGFISAEITVAFISCPFGIDQIGLSMVFFALGRFPTSFFCGFLTKKCGRLPLITLACAINLISLIILAQWHPGPSQVYIIHTMMFCWGLSDGIWISQVNGLISSIFKHHFEATLGGMRLAQGLGVTIFLSLSKFVNMEIKVFIMMAACLLALIGYLVMRICLYCENLHNQRQQKAYYIYTSTPKEDV
ncbi:Unc-93-like protein A [Elysia marginata]|uniref:Unc-93-like protein A n=1 Tax=Elysia marginata TaxID=1093978 RepID=A0AAV4G338_9GAST|nr:Unc-93-like protein A [Elysia marginata]